MADKRIEWTVLGRVIGTATAWDLADTFVMMLYDFEPVEGIDLPYGDVNFDFENGVVESFNDIGDVIRSVDLIQSIVNLPLQTRAS